MLAPGAQDTKEENQKLYKKYKDFQKKPENKNKNFFEQHNAEEEIKTIKNGGKQ